VANGTPDELKRKSEYGGAVLFSVRGATAAQLSERLSRIPNVRKAAIIKEEDGEIWARVYPGARGVPSRNGELVRNVLAAANGWPVQEIRTEEGRLDEVFRNFTLPEALNAAKGQGQ